MPRKAGRPDQPIPGSGRADSDPPTFAAIGRGAGSPPSLRVLLGGLWLLVLAGLVLKVWNQGSIVGTYDPALDQLLYAGQRRLVGALTYRDFVNGTPVVAQYLYAPSAWLGSLRGHRLLLLALSFVGSGLLWSCLQQLGALGLLALRRDSLVPPFAALLYVLFQQLFPSGSSGLLPPIVDTMLVLALFLLLRGLGGREPWPPLLSGAAGAPPPANRAPLASSAGDPDGGVSSGPALAANVSLALAGALLLLIVNALPPLLSPLLLLAVLLGLLLKPRHPGRLVLPIVGGGIGALLLLLLPYGVRPDGLAQVWAGAVQLPIELASRGSPPGDPLLNRLLQQLTLNLAGLPIWLLALVPSLELVRRWRMGSRKLLLLPGLAFTFNIDVLLALQRGESSRSELALLVLPLVLVISAGLASLESSPRVALRRTALATILLISLIYCNNVFLVTALHPPRGPGQSVRELEQDRAAVRAYITGLRPAPDSLQSPQDTALLRELVLASGGVGVGPDWSLDQQDLRPSWATRILRLPIGTAEVCRQLTAAPHSLVVWMQTDSRAANSGASLRACLARDGAGWQPIGEQLALHSGQIEVFRRAGTGTPSPGGVQLP